MFGAGGLFATQVLDLHGGPAAIVGVVAGVGGRGHRRRACSASLKRSESGEPFKIADLVGDEVYVAVAIPAGRYGSVLAKREGQTHEFSATSEQDIPAGRTVRVTGVAGSGLIVRDETSAAAPRHRARRARCSTLFNIWTASILAVIVPIIILVLLFAYATSRVKVAGANEALVRTGGVFGAHRPSSRWSAPGRVIVLPLVHRLGRIHLSARQINVNLSDAVTKQGIKVAVQGVATVKIGGDEESIRNAAERFLDHEDLLDSIVKNVLEGSLRSIVGTLTVEELNYDRQKFQQEVQGAAKADLATSGLAIDNFTIQAIRDEVGYMDLIGQQETARRERDARMAKATADQEAAVREAESMQIKLNAQRDVSLRQAEVEALTAAAEAKAAQAGPLAQAEAQQEVVKRQTELAQLEADRKQKELIASTIRPAEAEAEAQIRRAEGDKGARIAQAQAEAERVKLAGQAEASVQVTKGEAQARVTEVNADGHRPADDARGQRRGRASCSPRARRRRRPWPCAPRPTASSTRRPSSRTVLSMLPEIVRAAAEPIGQIGSLTVLSTDGASDVVRTTTRTLAEASASVKGLTGIDIPELLNDALGGEKQAAAPVAAKRKARTIDGTGGGDEGGGGTPPSGGSGPAPSGGGGAPSGGSVVHGTSAAAAARRSRTAVGRRAAAPVAGAAALARAAVRGGGEGHGGDPRPAPRHPPPTPWAASRRRCRPMPPVSDLRPGDRRRMATGGGRRGRSRRVVDAERVRPAAGPGARSGSRASSGSGARGCGTSTGAGRARCGSCGAPRATSSRHATATSPSGCCSTPTRSRRAAPTHRGKPRPGPGPPPDRPEAPRAPPESASELGLAPPGRGRDLELGLRLRDLRVGMTVPMQMAIVARFRAGPVPAGARFPHCAAAATGREGRPRGRPSMLPFGRAYLNMAAAISPAFAQVLGEIISPSSVNSNSAFCMDAGSMRLT